MRLTAYACSLGVVLALLLISLAQAATESTVYAFGFPGSGDGMYPYCTPIFDANGNLFGVTQAGGSHGGGIVFELSPGQGGQWTETVLHEFAGQSDGESPLAGLVFDSAGNLYGTAGYGGANGTGLVFELSPQGGSWRYKVLYNFGVYPNSGDGFAPNSALIFDKLGNLYGTTYNGGTGCFQGCGTVFELSPIQGGGWKEQVIHTFQTDGIDGLLPTGVAIDGKGALYGTTQNGGTAGSGVLYQLKYSPTNNQWSETIVHQFVGGNKDGSFPESVLLVVGGRLYGTTEGGGAKGYGTVFKTTFSKINGWRTKVLYSFGPAYSGDGIAPQAGVTMDANGNLYGTTSYGGAFNYYGTVFKLSKPAYKWVETVLYSFTGGTDGFYPGGGVTIRNGLLYGTTSQGGNSPGVVYQIQP